MSNSEQTGDIKLIESPPKRIKADELEVEEEDREAEEENDELEWDEEDEREFEEDYEEPYLPSSATVDMMKDAIRRQACTRKLIEEVGVDENSICGEDTPTVSLHSSKKELMAELVRRDRVKEEILRMLQKRRRQREQVAAN